MSLAQVVGPGSPDAHAARRALRAERAQLAHWRRLLRARLDLAVAALAPPEPLGTLSWDLVPDAVAQLPQPQDLTTAVRLPSIEDTVELMTRLRTLDRTLSRYESRLDDAWERATEDLLCGLAESDGPSRPADGR